MNNTLLKLLLALMTAVAAFEAYIIMNGNTPENTAAILQSKVGMCLDSTRYNITPFDNEGGTNVPETLKTQLIQRYISSVSINPNAFRSCIISKKALQAIFENDLNANAIQCDMASSNDPLQKNKNTLIFTGIRTKHFDIVDNITTSKYFYSTRFCPPKCSE